MKSFICFADTVNAVNRLETKETKAYTRRTAYQVKMYWQTEAGLFDLTLKEYVYTNKRAHFHQTSMHWHW